MSETLKTEFHITPDTHADANGHWDKVAIGDHLQIQFQNGPVKEFGINGVQLPQVLRICLARYKMLNKSFRCRENSIVIRHLEDAIMWDDERTAKRTTQGVEGYDRPHSDDDD